ncbi:Ydr140wp-like family archaeal-RNA methylase [Cryptosporidium sp. chipmunk genotype I]|uniref:Ydr140wp-like family archaeal-RNA methylase n=1 Tax=Cryptosporidium sp. chipmunk genotype I TaxID=1280935 RepID=UPI00351A7D19|nr:Ydr140wp-like family archaeal-RNA methylase [Cryptosporidium sp. chipmunk genotype I]
MISLSFTNRSDWESVYEPSEDSFLMEDALILEKSEILKLKPRLICEIGCGSGYLTACLLKIIKELEEGPPLPIAYLVDVNINALEMSRRVVSNNKINGSIELVKMSLFTCFIKNRGLFEIIIFNPPYVPSSNKELNRSILNCGIDSAWSGGANGLFFVSYFLFGDKRLILSETNNQPQEEEIIRIEDQFRNFPCLVDVLAQDGVCYLLLEENNLPKFTFEQILKDPRYSGWNAQFIIDRKVQLEHLYILKLAPK